ncbi:methionine/alanine import family NSS transporter small subunit [Nocardiopsis sp. NPDC058631]
MSTSAIVMMAVSVIVLWGGLIASVIHLRRHPEEPEAE